MKVQITDEIRREIVTLEARLNQLYIQEEIDTGPGGEGEEEILREIRAIQSVISYWAVDA